MEKVKYDIIDNSVVRIVLDDGKGNILDTIMMQELHSIFQKMKEIPDIKLITTEGAGKNFSFGASVAEHTKEKAPDMLRAFHQLFYDIIELSIPFMAKVSGQCLGGAMELVLACNFIMADKSAKFGQPEIILGVFPPPASIILPLKIGYARAESIILTGNSISAEIAFKNGLVNEIFEDKITMEAGVSEWIAKNISGKSASSLRFAVQAVRNQWNEILISKLPVIEELYSTKLMETNDANEGINSFLEKRIPIWTNK